MTSAENPPVTEEPECRTDERIAAHWRSVLDELERRLANKETDLEAYFRARSMATSHLLTAEARMELASAKKRGVHIQFYEYYEVDEC